LGKRDINMITHANIIFSHNSTKHTGATANLLVTPTFANWVQNPGTAANLVDELTNNVLTTNGIGAAGNNDIKYDLGDSRRRIIRLQCDEQTECYVSDDGINYYFMMSNVKASLVFGGVGIGKFRFVKFTVVGAVTINEFKARCYNLN